MLDASVPISARAAAPGSFRALWQRYLGPHKARVALLALLIAGALAAQLAAPQVVRGFLDAAQAGRTGRPLLVAAVLFILFTIFQHGLNLAALYVSNRVAWAATNRLRADLALHCLRLDMDFHKRRTPGEMIERIEGDSGRLAGFFSQFVLRIAANALLIAGILLLLFREDLRLGAALTAYTLLVLLALRLIQGRATRHWEAERVASVATYGFMEERISGAEEIRAVGAEAATLRRMDGLSAGLVDARRRAQATGSATHQLTNLIGTAGYVLAIALAAWLFLRGQFSLGTVYLIVSYASMLEDPVQNIRHEAQNFQQAAASARRILELLALQPAVDHQPRSGLAPAAARAGAAEVQARAVSFRYEDGENVLDDVSFTLPPGQVLGVLGRTGSGKTTLTRLLFRLYDPQSGQVCLNGSDLRDLPLAELREQVALVTQDVQLFAASLRDNLRFFDERLPDAALWRALDDLRLREWVERLPAGLDTPLGGSAGARGLSAGEAQLLAFARVFLKDPALVILDEASSRLDPSTEARVERAIDRLFAGRTGVVIAHRLHTVQRADWILILEQGRVAEFGPRLALAADPHSRFAALLRAGLEEVLV